VTLTATITDADGDFRTASIDLGARISFLDDGPSISATGEAPALSVDETLLATDTDSANFASAFSSLPGADGATITYGLGMAGANGLDSGLGTALLVSGAVVSVSGFVGIVLWSLGPAWLTRLERDLSIEEAFALDEHLVRELDANAAAIGEPLAARIRALGRSPPSADSAAHLMAEAGADPARRLQVEDALVLAGQRARVGAELRRLTRARFAFQAWRIAHLPFVVVLTVLVGLHLWTVWRY
jgi:hypothetical protein